MTEAEKKAALEMARLVVSEPEPVTWGQGIAQPIARALLLYASRVEKLEEALRFYADYEGDRWAACQPDDTAETCCHMVAEASGGDVARTALSGDGERGGG